MANKKQQLLEKARQSVRTPKPERLQENQRRRNYRLVGVSMDSSLAGWVDDTVKLFHRVPNFRVTRSLLIEEAVRGLQEQLSGKDPDDIIKNILERISKRV